MRQERKEEQRRKVQPPEFRHRFLGARFTRNQFDNEACVSVSLHRRDSQTTRDKGIGDTAPLRTLDNSFSISRRRRSRSSRETAGRIIHNGFPLSVTCTDLPARVMRLTLSGSRTRVRREIAFIPADSTVCRQARQPFRSRLAKTISARDATAKSSSYLALPAASSSGMK